MTPSPRTLPATALRKRARALSAATFVSRLFGLAREQTFAYLFGAGYAVDAFVAAFRIPNLLRDLFAEGALSSAFVPVFTDTLTTRGKEEAFRLGNLTANVLNVIIVGRALAAPRTIMSAARPSVKDARRWA